MHNFAIRMLLVGLFAASLGSQPALAQRTITLDNEGCVLGLEALGKLVGARVKASNTPQKVGGRCRANAVRLTSDAVTLQIDQMEWAAGGLTTLASGKMPAALRLTLTGTYVTSAPGDDPVWSVLAAQMQGMDAELLLGFSSSENVLTIHRAQVDFQNNNVVTLNGSLGNVSPLVPENPVLGMASYLLNDLTLTVSNGLSAPNPVWEILQTAVSQEELEMFAVSAPKDLENVLSDTDIRALQNLIRDLPRPSGTLRLLVNSPVGYAFLRLVLVRNVGDLKTVLDGLEIHFSYGVQSN